MLAKSKIRAGAREWYAEAADPVGDPDAVLFVKTTGDHPAAGNPASQLRFLRIYRLPFGGFCFYETVVIGCGVTCSQPQRRKPVKSLSPSENSTVIRARILGVETMQLPAFERLRKIGVPEDMVKAAATASDQETFDRAEGAIIAWATEKWATPNDVLFVNPEEVLPILNGRDTFGQAARRRLE